MSLTYVHLFAVFKINEHQIKVNTSMGRINRNTEEEIFKLAIEAFRKQFPMQRQIDTLTRQQYHTPALLQTCY